MLKEVAAPRQGKCPGRNISALAVALAVKSGNNTITYQYIITALAEATSYLSTPCHEQWTDAATDSKASYF